MNFLNSKRLPDIIATVAFLFYVVIGLFIVGDFGAIWDDDCQRLVGVKSVEYLFFHDYEPLRHSLDRYHGPAFEMVLYILEVKFHITDGHSLYLLRHTGVFLYTIVCLFAFYFLIRKLFSNKWMPLVGCLIFVLHPRVFADSFYNPKDIPSMGGMMIAMYTLVRLSATLSWRNLILHAFASAWVVDIRVICVILPMATVGILLYKNLWIEKQPMRMVIIKTAAYIFVTFAFMIPMWPILMDGPFHEIVAAARQMSANVEYHGLNLFNGKFYTGADTPGQYQFVWFFMTTPVIYSLAFIAGIILLCYEFLKSRGSFTSNIFIWLSLGFYIVPPAAMWYAHTIVNGGWRHVFMIYPFFVLVCVFAINKLIEKGAVTRTVVVCIVTASLLFNLGMTCYLHPFEYTYFNPVAVKCLAPLDKRFEIDYYGPSFRQGFNYLLKKHYKGKPLKVIVSNHPGYENYLALPAADRAKIKFLQPYEEKDADFFLNMHRWDQHPSQIQHPIYEYRRLGNRIMTIYTLP